MASTKSLRSAQSPQSREPSSTRRARVTQACDQCRLSRRKCDSSLPSCCACVSLRLECSYAQEQRKRGKPTGYIWALEVILALLLDEQPTNAETIRDFVASSAANRECRFSVHNEALMKQLHAAWRDSETLKDINAMLSGHDPPPINYKPRGQGPKNCPKLDEELGTKRGMDGASQWPLV